MNDQKKDLPPLPESSAWRYRPKDGLTWPAYTEREAQALAYDAQPEPLYTADQMRDYAIAALARHCAAPVAEAQPVAKVSPDELRDIQQGRMGVPIHGRRWRDDQTIPLYTAPIPPAPQEVEQARDATAGPTAADAAGHGRTERLNQLSDWLAATGALPVGSSWIGELEAIVAGKGAPDDAFTSTFKELIDTLVDYAFSHNAPKCIQARAKLESAIAHLARPTAVMAGGLSEDEQAVIREAVRYLGDGFMPTAGDIIRRSLLDRQPAMGSVDRSPTAEAIRSAYTEWWRGNHEEAYGSANGWFAFAAGAKWGMSQPRPAADHASVFAAMSAQPDDSGSQGNG